MTPEVWHQQVVTFQQEAAAMLHPVLWPGTLKDTMTLVHRALILLRTADILLHQQQQALLRAQHILAAARQQQ